MPKEKVIYECVYYSSNKDIKNYPLPKRPFASIALAVPLVFVRHIPVKHKCCRQVKLLV